MVDRRHQAGTPTRGTPNEPFLSLPAASRAGRDKTIPDQSFVSCALIVSKVMAGEGTAGNPTGGAAGVFCPLSCLPL